VLIAFAPAGVVELTIVRGMRRYTAHTVTSPVQLRRALADTRAAQVAITRQELELGLSGVAMPVFGPGGVAVASIELTVRNMTNGLPLALSAVYIAARSLSRELGGYSRPEHSERAGRAFAGPVTWEPMAASG
jgi:DNA-binding IclR family transcriptional regulator